MKRTGKLGGETASPSSGSREGRWWIPPPLIFSWTWLRKGYQLTLNTPETIAVLKMSASHSHS